LNPQNRAKNKMLAIITAILALSILCVPQAQASTLAGQVTIVDEPPQINSVQTYSYYVNQTENTPAANFSAFGNRTVYIQVNVSDINGAAQITNYGGVKIKIVLWNTTDETTFGRFGQNYADATLEEANQIYAIYKYQYQMKNKDPSRTGTETPPLYYRVKAEVYDGEYLVPSDLTSQQNADYTYYGLPRILINEFQPTYDGSMGFIEIYNQEEYAIELDGWSLIDVHNTTPPYALTGTIPPAAILVYYSNTTGMALNPRGDNPGILAPLGEESDNFTYYDGMTLNGRTYRRTTWDSIGRLPNGTDTWTVFKTPSPGQPNPEQYQREIPQQPGTGGGGGGPAGGLMPRLPKPYKIELPIIPTTTTPVTRPTTTPPTQPKAVPTTVVKETVPETKTSTTSLPPAGPPRRTWVGVIAVIAKSALIISAAALAIILIRWKLWGNKPHKSTKFPKKLQKTKKLKFKKET